MYSPLTKNSPSTPLAAALIATTKGGALQSLFFVIIAIALVSVSPVKRYSRSANFVGRNMIDSRRRLQRRLMLWRDGD